jgi:hypothetical protein
VSFSRHGGQLIGEIVGKIRIILPVLGVGFSVQSPGFD